jgi:hypothetical protein
VIVKHARKPFESERAKAVFVRATTMSLLGDEITCQTLIGYLKCERSIAIEGVRWKPDDTFARAVPGAPLG